MPKDETLRKVEAEIEAGDLGKARDRLHGLVVTYPCDLSLRSWLGGVYWALQYPERAGCYWYLEEDTTPEMEAARKAFENRWGGDPLRILRALKFRAEPMQLESDFAMTKLLDLQERCEKEQGIEYPFEEAEPQDQSGGKGGACFTLGCILAFIAALLVLVAGVHAIYRFIFSP